MAPIVSYNGKDPYIFISYSHRDTEKVNKIVGEMQELGFRCWFDEGIDPGTEWDENIAYHMKECSYVIAFISSAYLASENCKDELNYARDLNKPRLLVYIENVTLPEGMAMRLNRLQAIHWYTYSDTDMAMQKIVNSYQIDVCREEKAVEGEKAEAAEVTVNQESENFAAKKDNRTEIKEEKPTDDGKASIQNTNLKKFLPIIAVIAVGILILAVVIGLLIKGKGDSDISTAVEEPARSLETESLESAEAPAVTEEPAAEVDPWEDRDYVKLAISAPDSMSVKGFEDAKKLVEERLMTLAGEGNYEIQYKTDTIEVNLALDALNGLEVKNVIPYFVASAARISLYDGDSLENRLMNNYPKDYITINRTDVEKVELVRGTQGEFHVLSERTEAPVGDDVYHIEITLTDAFLNRCRATIESWGNPLFGQDVPENGATGSWYNCATAFSEDYKTILVSFDNLKYENFRNTTLSNFENKPLDDTLEYSIVPMFDFKSLEELKNIGEYQCAADSIPDEEGVIFTYRFYDDLTEGEALDTDAVLRTRLDALGKPYALGRVKNSQNIAVKMYLNQVDTLMADTIAGSAGYLKFSYDLTKLTTYSTDIVLEDGNDASQICMKVILYSSDVEEVQNFIDDCGAECYLLWDTVRVANCTLSLEGECLIAQMDASCKSIINYYLTCLNNKMPESGNLDSKLVVGEDGYEDALLKEYGDVEAFKTYNANVRSSIQQLDPKATVGILDRVLFVYLNYEVDADLNTKTIQTLEAIYEMLDFESGYYDSVNIYIIDENNDYGERARCFFSTNYGTYPKMGFVDSHGIYRGGRLEAYKEDFRKQLEKSEIWELSLMGEWGYNWKFD